MQSRRVAVGLTAALFLLASTTAGSAAATHTPYNANFPRERTILGTCPAGVPAGAACFSGSDGSRMGTSTPPVPTDTHATEEFTGFLDLSRPIPHACPPIPGTTLGTAGFPDHNLVTIGTTRGDLFLTTDGVDCVSTNTDDGVWHAMGGTGIFRGATGGGTVHTEAGLGTGTAVDPIPSASTYTGSLTLS